MEAIVSTNKRVLASKKDVQGKFIPISCPIFIIVNKNVICSKDKLMDRFLQK